MSSWSEGEKRPFLARVLNRLSEDIERHDVDNRLSTHLGGEDGDYPDLPSILKKPEGEVERKAEVGGQLREMNQVIFYGPPGTGKTRAANRFAKQWVQENTSKRKASEDHVRSVAFHPSFSYEDFVEGLETQKEDGEVVYNYSDGIFKEIYQDDKKAYEEYEDAPPYILIIDEINRGNIAQILGEMITLLESDKRMGEEESTTVEFAHTGTSVTLPPNLYVIGTMNTADQSIALIDFAIRRRFSFHSFPPDMSVVLNHNNYNDIFDFNLSGDDREGLRDAVEEVYEDSDRESEPYRRLVTASVLSVEVMNDNILSDTDLNKGKRIGHSYLLGHSDEEELRDAWRHRILPLLEEYFFGDFDSLRREVFDDEPTEGEGEVISQRLLNLESNGGIADFSVQELEEGLNDLIDREL